MKKSLTNILGAGLVALGGAGMLGGCSDVYRTLYENEPFIRDIMPFGPGPRKSDSSSNSGGSGCIEVTISKEGYSFKKEICKGTKVHYQGKEGMVWSINPPNIEISYKVPGTYGVYNSKDSFIIKIVDLFKE